MADESSDSQEHIYTSLRSLVRLRHFAQGFDYLPQQPMRSVLSGRKRSSLRGRGLDFDELRHYQPGDDIRNMDWRVTNRTGKPHVRSYTEERDRPVFVVVDQRIPMFFGSVLKMKSVAAAEAAALSAWRVLSVGDRVGAILFNDATTIEVKPSRNPDSVVRWLSDLCDMNNALHVSQEQATNPDALNEALVLLERTIGHDFLVLLISDLHGWNDATLASIRRISRHNDVVCSLIFDPLEKDISQASNLVVSDGTFQLQIDPKNNQLGERFEASFNSSLSHVQKELQRHQIPVIPIDTLSPVTQQLREKLGGQRGSV